MIPLLNSMVLLILGGTTVTATLDISGLEKITMRQAIITCVNVAWTEIARTKVFIATATVIWL